MKRIFINNQNYMFRFRVIFSAAYYIYDNHIYLLMQLHLKLQGYLWLVISSEEHDDILHRVPYIILAAFQRAQIIIRRNMWPAPITCSTMPPN